jgi:hypothetical protein
MTSNQVANAANQIQKQSVEEQARHNAAYEEETTRHNTVTEELTRLQIELENEKMRLEQDYKRQALAIQKEYNDMYLTWQRAQGEEKLKLEAQLNLIKQREQQAQEVYQSGLIAIQSRANDISQQSADERKRNNQVLEELQARGLTNEETKTLIAAKQLEYQNSYWNSSINLGYHNSFINQQRNLNDYTLGLMSMEQGAAKIQLDTYKWAAEKQKLDSEVFRNYVNAVGSMFSAGANAISSVYMGVNSLKIPTPKSINNLFGGK